MNSSFFRPFSYMSIGFILFVIFLCLFFIPLLTYYPSAFGISFHEDYSFDSTDSEYLWPIPGYTKLSSAFGKRISPTAGASSFHKGIDIVAPEGTPLYAICDGTITFASFLGGGGYTITLSTEELKISYCHVSPNFLVHVGDSVEQGDLIATVGPKYVDAIPHNPYRDPNGRPTNGATTGCHLHFGVRVENTYINPLELYQKNKE